LPQQLFHLAGRGNGEGMTTQPPLEGKPPRTAADKVDRSRLIGGIVIAVVAIWFILANHRSAKITFWVATVSAPMWLVLAGTFIAGMLASLLFTRVRNSKKER
jgi:uncharacterized integral membrane protein